MFHLLALENLPKGPKKLLDLILNFFLMHCIVSGIYVSMELVLRKCLYDSYVQAQSIENIAIVIGSSFIGVLISTLFSEGYFKVNLLKNTHTQH